MPECKVPYGKGELSFFVPEEELSEILVSRLADYVPEGTPEELVSAAMKHPVGSPRLSELAKGKKNIVILASDHTRPVPSRVIIPPMLQEIREGNPEAEITILIATGCHRETKEEELRAKFGDDIVDRERIVIHDCDNAEFTDFGKLPSGGPLLVNSIAAEADLLVAEGFIEPHFFAGFSGGRKSVLPGVAARKVVIANHNGRFIADEHSRTGNLKDNPIHRDMLYAAKKAGLSYIVNVVLDTAHKPIFAVAGDVEKAHEEGCRFLSSYCGVHPKEEADVVITSNDGYPLDQNLYQAVKGMTGAEPAVRQGGVIIMCARCEDGHGGESFYETFRGGRELSALMKEFIETPAEETIIDQWQSQIFVRVLLRATVILVSELDDAMVRDFRMLPAKSVEEALSLARGLLNKEKIRVTVIPGGVGVVTEPVS